MPRGARSRARTGDSYADVEPVAGGTFRVTVHPAGRDDKADSAFTIVAV